MPRPTSSRDALLELLNDGTRLTYAEMAPQIGLGDRQTRRLVKTLLDEGLIQEERKGRQKAFLLKPEHRRTLPLPELQFTEQEAFALTVAAEAARATLYTTPLGEPLKQAFGKLLGVLAEDVFTFEPEDESSHWHFGAVGYSPVDAEVFRTLNRAITQQRRVRIDYYTAGRNETSYDRPIDPLVLAMPGGSWIVVAYCHKRRKLLDFALAGIQQITLTKDHFLPPGGFHREAYFRDRFGALAGEVHAVRLRVDAKRIPYFHRKQYHATQQIEEQPNGTYEVSFAAAGLEAIRSFCQSWGVGITVLAPPELVARMAEEAQELAQRYR